MDISLCDNSQLPVRFYNLGPSILLRSQFPTGRDSVAGIATRYGLDGPGIENPGGDEILRAGQTGPVASCKTGTGSFFPGVKAAEAWR